MARRECSERSGLRCNDNAPSYIVRELDRRMHRGRPHTSGCLLTTMETCRGVSVAESANRMQASSLPSPADSRGRFGGAFCALPPACPLFPRACPVSSQAPAPAGLSTAYRTPHLTFRRSRRIVMSTGSYRPVRASGDVLSVRPVVPIPDVESTDTQSLRAISVRTDRPAVRTPEPRMNRAMSSPARQALAVRSREAGRAHQPVEGNNRI